MLRTLRRAGGIGIYAGNIGTIAQVADNSLKVYNKDITHLRYGYRMAGTATSFGAGTAITAWGVGGSYAGPYGTLIGGLLGVGFQGIEYSYDIIAPQIQESFNHTFNALNSGNFVR